MFKNAKLATKEQVHYQFGPWLKLTPSTKKNFKSAPYNCIKNMKYNKRSATHTQKILLEQPLKPYGNERKTD